VPGELEPATTVVLAHVLMNDLGVIGIAARTLEERWDDLPALVRERLLDMINDTVHDGLDRLRLIVAGASCG
jgi:hypothetical protein